ncbi:heme o synthase [Corynebacterium choanae]|uniref:Protoheme IX farnesyltransferase n=1 Tax=Corynebacterium choanae TaxID=1862358 RepID=A0A3G6J776_9CORY|nr:heme o synthase [Corynebacterium choanae]AZA13623.1 Protoheme IX farnesyltransferase [Corynebacterium choanae]
METIRSYFALTKPRVIELLLVASFPAMLQADRGANHVGLILATVIGGWMGAAAANTFNMIADSDIDQKMRRTQRRPLAAHTVTNQQATVFAWSLTVASFLWLWLLCGSLLAAVFVMITIAFYIFVYTKWLKRSTPQNVVWGGAAGCMPVMVGWAVIVDHLPDGEPHRWWQAAVLFMVIFFWTPPHTWALAMKYKDDYAAAGVPMMPVVRPPAVVTKQIVLYTWATVATTLLLLPAAGLLYGVVAIGAGIWFIVRAHMLHKGVLQGIEVQPMKLFLLSNNYLAIVFVALSVDAYINLPLLGDVLTGIM